MYIYSKQILIKRTSDNKNSSCGSLVVCLSEFLLYAHLQHTINYCVYLVALHTSVFGVLAGGSGLKLLRWAV